jgi:hypothetical protein
MPRPSLILLAACAPLSCAEEPLPEVKPTQATVVATSEVPESESLQEALVRAYLADDASAVPIVYCIKLSEYDQSEERFRLYDPPQSFFDRFKGEELPIFASYHRPPPTPPDGLRRRMVIGPFWREPGNPDLLAEVGDSSLLDRRHETGAIYSAVWGPRGWKVTFRDPPPP